MKTKTWFLKIMLLATVIMILIIIANQQPSSAQVIKVTKYHESVPLTNPGMFVPCALDGEGEFVAWYGNMNFIIYATQVPTGTYHAIIHQNPQGAYGVGETSNQIYRVAGADAYHENFTGEGGWLEGQANLKELRTSTLSGLAKIIT
ncbi:MAG TPA: hypothetical protein PLN61_12035 [bacterium]|nr:hypothetical protein [bacterium]HQI49378.1 hypothetical protein [bacterium]HQJ66240.1 hypothetical protein [bacterium]